MFVEEIWFLYVGFVLEIDIYKFIIYVIDERWWWWKISIKNKNGLMEMTYQTLRR